MVRFEENDREAHIERFQDQRKCDFVCDLEVEKLIKDEISQWSGKIPFDTDMIEVFTVKHLRALGTAMVFSTGGYEAFAGEFHVHGDITGFGLAVDVNNHPGRDNVTKEESVRLTVRHELCHLVDWWNRGVTEESGVEFEVLLMEFQAPKRGEDVNPENFF